MSDPKAPDSNGEEAAWLPGVTAGDADPDTRVARVAGGLIRARFNAALKEVRAEPDVELTRARILARARSSGSRRTGGLLRSVAAGVTGLAAGIMATVIWIQGANPRAEFGAVTSVESVSAPPDSKALEIIMKRYVIHSRNATETAGQLVTHLVRAHANLRVQNLPDGSVQIDLESVPSVTEDLAAVGRRLGVTITAGEPLQLTIQSGR